jgi:hypothetical protein
MQLIVHVPDDLIENVKDKLPPPSVGVMEAVALDAILGFLNRLAAGQSVAEAMNPRNS